MGEAGDDDAGERGNDSDEQDGGEARDLAEIAIEQGHDEEAGCGRGEVGVVQGGESGEGSGFEAGPEPGEESREADASGGDGEGRGEAELPDEDEAEPVSGAIGRVDFAEKGVGSAGAGKGCAELGPYESVGDGDGGAQHPGPDGKAVARGCNDEREGDEGADADHLEHVEEHGGAESDAALEMYRVVRDGFG